MDPKDKIELVEKLLFRLGYDVDEPDGILDEKTTKAVLQFQQSAGLPESGIITFRLIDALVAKVAE
jgi:peptidoglycan hydrolase-like protein with peptidoglycan-binding domain